MNYGGHEITFSERTVWLRVCSGQTIRRMSIDLKRTMFSVAETRRSLCQKLGVREDDTAAIVRAADVAGILSELPPIRRK